ncbi:MAG: methylated-DNA--[protein]-cysteine S-methyltransferase [Thermoanaerobaculia bacterium]
MKKDSEKEKQIAGEKREFLRRSRVAAPPGAIVLVVRGSCLVGLVFEDHWKKFNSELEKRFGAFSFEEDPRGGAPAEALRRYFGGDLAALDGIAVDTGGTAFQQIVWTTLRRIPAGATWSYARLAKEIGRPSATRAVAAANGANPVSIVVPCHRVIGSDGSLTGYGGGLPRKRWLLAHEGALLL